MENSAASAGAGGCGVCWGVGCGDLPGASAAAAGPRLIIPSAALAANIRPATTGTTRIAANRRQPLMLGKEKLDAAKEIRAAAADAQREIRFGRMIESGQFDQQAGIANAVRRTAGGKMVGHLVLAEAQFTPQKPIAGLEPKQRLERLQEPGLCHVVIANVRPFVRQTMTQRRLLGRGGHRHRQHERGSQGPKRERDFDLARLEDRHPTTRGPNFVEEICDFARGRSARAAKPAETLDRHHRPQDRPAGPDREHDEQGQAH